MGQHRHAAAVSDELCTILQGNPLPVHIAAAPHVQVPPKGLLDRLYRAHFHQLFRNLRPPQHSAGMGMLQLLQRDVIALFPELFENSLVAVPPCLPDPLAVLCQLGRIRVQKIAQHMDLPALILRRDLNAGHHRDPKQRSGLSCLLNACHRIMVRQGNGLDPQHSRQGNYLLGAHGPIGRRGVYMHINLIHSKQPFLSVSAIIPQTAGRIHKKCRPEIRPAFQSIVVPLGVVFLPIPGVGAHIR